MAPLTRQRCDENHVPNDMVIEYYTQRSGFGLIITEVSQVSSRSNCFKGSGAIYNEQQMQGWKKVVDSVHKNEGKIFICLYHCGRATHASLQNNQEPWAPSNIPIKTEKMRMLNNADFPVPKAMTEADIQTLLSEYRQSAMYAKQAGFDGIEIHAANGYLMDQFLRDYSNRRNDRYGGCIENRCRLPLMVIDTVLEVYPASRVAIRISPTNRSKDMYDSDPCALYSYFLTELDQRKLSFVEIREASDADDVQIGEKKPARQQIKDCLTYLKQYFKGVIISNQDYTIEAGLKRIQNGDCDAISFGRLAISNPDLPDRIKNNYPINTQYDNKTFYSSGSKGYTDYPTYSEQMNS